MKHKQQIKTRIYKGSASSDYIEIGPGDLIAGDEETYMFIGEVPASLDNGSRQIKLWCLDTLRVETIWNTYWATCRVVSRL